MLAKGCAVIYRVQCECDDGLEMCLLMRAAAGRWDKRGNSKIHIMSCGKGRIDGLIRWD